MENHAIDLTPYIGKNVRIAIQEEPSRPDALSVKKGKLLGFDADFIQIETFENIHLINRKTIRSLKLWEPREL